VLPVSATPMVMFSIDLSTAAATTYAGCTTVGGVGSYCAPAQYFKDNCSSCVLPAANKPLTYLHAIRYALRMALSTQTSAKVGLMLSHNQEANCAGPRPAVPTTAQKCSNGGYIARGFNDIDWL